MHVVRTEHPCRSNLQSLSSILYHYIPICYTENMDLFRGCMHYKTPYSTIAVKRYRLVPFMIFCSLQVHRSNFHLGVYAHTEIGQ